MTDRPFPIADVRAAFPSLSITDAGRPRVYFDNPAGTQVPTRVIERATRAYVEQNANLGGAFETSRRASALVEEAHEAVARFYNAKSAKEIVFGQSMTALTYHISRCLSRGWTSSDEIILSRMDHDANVAPWLQAAEDRGVTVRWLDFDPDTYEFPDRAIDDLLSSRTRLVAVGYASNCTGTINDVTAICAKARAAGALSYIDAVQFAPHGVIDVEAVGCDFLVSSAYKFFGPHIGVLFGREPILEAMFAYQVRPAQQGLPKRFELGTGSREGMAATLGALEYIASLAGSTPGAAEPTREALAKGMQALADHEQGLTLRLIEGLKQVRGLTVRGITSANAMHRRVPTVSFTLERHHPDALAKGFADDNIFVWSGHNYAIEPVGRMGLLDKGGVLRVGLAHYNTAGEVDALLQRLDRMTTA
ncbi:MAG: cysteine desulfurase-like protein [Hyphomicrobiales bacterium]